MVWVCGEGAVARLAGFVRLTQLQEAHGQSSVNAGIVRPVIQAATQV
ncbi:MAG: hypothetical protein ACJA00_001768 [Myxococcota bacterium]|jgi:hypothetical protein